MEGTTELSQGTPCCYRNENSSKALPDAHVTTRLSSPMLLINALLAISRESTCVTVSSGHRVCHGQEEIADGPWWKAQRQVQGLTATHRTQCQLERLLPAMPADPLLIWLLAEDSSCVGDLEKAPSQACPLQP